MEHREGKDGSSLSTKRITPFSAIVGVDTTVESGLRLIG